MKHANENRCELTIRPMTEASREARARREARKLGVRLMKSRRNGRYALHDPSLNILVFGQGRYDFDASLNDIEAWLAD